MGVLEPITGPAASLGKLQNDWIQFYVNAHNKTHKKGKLRLAKGDTVLGGPGGTAEAVKAAQSLASNVLGVIGPAGSNEVKAATPTLMNAGFAFVSGSATNTEITIRRNAEGLLLPHGAAGRDSEHVGVELHQQEAEVQARLHHRRPGGLQHRPRRRGSGQAAGSAASPSRVTASASSSRTSPR